MKMNDILLNKIYLFASEKHKKVNHFYDIHEYSYHLNKVSEVAHKFINLVSYNDYDLIIASCYCHDLIEDTRLTYNDLKNELIDIIYNDCNDSYFYYEDCENLALKIAEITYALTNEKGRNRKERANNKYYMGIKDIKYATFIKLCDRISNIEYSSKEGNKLEMYKKENNHFLNQLYVGEGLYYKKMFDYIDKLLNENTISN